MSRYANFSFYYDALTQDVDYPKRAKYILTLLERHRHSPGLTLDLACGTGSLLFELLLQEVDVFGVDASPEMLAQAKDKSYELEKDVLLLCQKMQELDLYGTVDTVVCTLDSLNHLRNEAELLQAFSRVFLFLNPGGLFVFDMNTIYKHAEILGNNAYVYETPEVFCAWQNQYRPKGHVVDIRLDFFQQTGKTYQRSSEQFSERAYPLADIEAMLKKIGFINIHQYNELQFTLPQADSQRVFFVAEKAE